MNSSSRFALVLTAIAGIFGASSSAGAFPDTKSAAEPTASHHASPERWQVGSLSRRGQKGLESLSVTETWFFGSSTTDSGDFQAAIPIIPDPPYFQGRFSNGPVWAEYFADILGTDSTASALGGTNFAFGGARTNVLSLGFIPPITSQVDKYLDRVGFVADPEALYIFQTAANDLTAAKLELPETAKLIMQDAVAATEGMLVDLFNAGARNFMLLKIPELPTAPTSAVLPDGTNLAQLTNDGFAEIADEFRVMGANVWIVDLHALVNDVVDDPNSFGLEVAHCSYMGKSALAVLSGDLTPEPCDSSVPVDEYMMFDDEHYTTAMHNILAHEALSELCAGQWPTEGSPLRPCIVLPNKSGPGALPFKLDAEGQLTVIPPFESESDPRCNANLTPDGEYPGAFVTILESGTGMGSYLGQSSFETTSCLDPVTGEAPGWGVMTAANGDQLVIEFFNSPIPAPGGFSGFAGPQTVVGGTGRFEGASGDQECRGQVNSSDLSVEFECIGHLAIEPGTPGQ